MSRDAKLATPRHRRSSTAHAEPLKGDVTMQSNTTKAPGAHFPLSVCANRTTTSPWRTRDSITIAAIAIVAFLGASAARAADVIQEMVLPFANASAGAGGTFPALSLGDGSDPSKPLVNAEATQGGATAVGRIGIVDFARADAPSQTSAAAEFYMEFTVEDPQNRPQVKTIFNFKGVLSSPPDSQGSSRGGGASWNVNIGASDGRPLVLDIHDNLYYNYLSAPGFVGTPVFQLGTNIDSAGGGSCASQIDINGQRVSTRNIASCSNITEGGSLELTHAPGTYLMRVVVIAGNNATVVGDPVWLPHPDNPDVIIRRHAPTGLPGAPLAGITPDDLTARGIDPTPFVDAGFFDPSSAPPPSDPPPPPPVIKDWCGPGFWLNNAVNFGASAWPVSAPVYYDYNATAGQLAGCPIATGNPTLLQVLRNPSLYFSTQLKGSGFNCVGDYLSTKSGLLGTKADNDGVCSIDQLGRPIQ
jgi:hypothetical protein